MWLLIDNYDSFTYNLVHYFKSLGCALEVVKHDAIDVASIAEINPQGLILSPGPGTPEDAGVSLAAIAAFANKLPILGVCLGHQCLAQHFGAKIDQASTIMHGKTSEVHHDGSELFAGISQPFTAARYHSLAIAPESVSPCLQIRAWTENAKGQMEDIMAISHKQRPLLGLQFHPEAILTPEGKQILANSLNWLDAQSLK